MILYTHFAQKVKICCLEFYVHRSRVMQQMQQLGASLTSCLKNSDKVMTFRGAISILCRPAAAATASLLFKWGTTVKIGQVAPLMMLMLTVAAF